MERGSSMRDMVYPPIYEGTNRWGETVYLVVFSDNRRETIQFLDPHPLSREEALERVQETLRYGLRDGRYPARDFYPPQYANGDLQLHPAVAVDDDGRRALEEDEAYGQQQQQQQHWSGGAPASAEAVAALPEITSVDGGEDCSVCLQEFEAGSRLRMIALCACFPSGLHLQIDGSG